MFRKKTIPIPALPKTVIDYIPSPVWKTSEKLTTDTKNLFKNPTMRGLVELLRRESPKQLIHLPLNAGESEQLRLASIEDGYWTCVNKLLSLQHLESESTEIEATFEER